MGEAVIVRRLLDHGANANARDKNGRTPLLLTWRIEIMRLLLDYGASVNAKDKEGMTLLKREFRSGLGSGKYETVRMLVLEYGARVDNEQ